MKAFICGIITIAVLIGAVVANTVFITKRTERIIEEIDSLPDTAKTADLSALSDHWESSRTIISLTVHRENVDDIDDTLEQLKLSVRKGDDHTYLINKTKLLCTAKRLKKTESFSLSRIF